MNTQRLAFAVGSALVLGWVAVFALRPAEHDGRPLAGTLAPLDTTRVEAWQTVARLSVDDIGGTQINGLDARGDTLIVVQRAQWHLIVAGKVIGSFGSEVSGSPEHLARGVGAALLPHTVAILDGSRSRVTQWSRTGVRALDIDLRGREGLGMQQPLAVASDSAIFVPGYEMSEDGGSWQLVRASAAAVDTVIIGQRSPGDGRAYDIPWPIPLPDGSFYVIDANSWRIRLLRADGAELRSTVRTAAPRFPVPRLLASRMRQHLARTPEGLRSAIAMGPTLPPVVGATLAPDGNLLVLTGTGEESSILELVTPAGVGLATLWSAPVDDRTFAVRGAIYRLQELDDVIVISRQRLKPHER